MNQFHEKPTIAVSHARSFNDNERFLERHVPLAGEVAKYGANLIALNGAKDRDGGKSFSSYYSFDSAGSGLTRHDESVQVDSALDLTGGIARYTPAISALNPIGVREIVRSKQSQYDTLKDLGDHVPFTAIVPATSEAVVDALDSIESKRIIIKPDLDPDKVKPMIVGTKSEILHSLDQYLSHMNPEKDLLVVQEYVEEVRSDFDPAFRFINEQEREIANSAKDLNRELRVHVMDGKPILTTARVGLDPSSRLPRDEWVHVDQDTVPEHVLDLASAAARTIMREANEDDAFLAVDLTPDGTKIVEVNGRNIGTMSVEEGRPASRYAHDVTTTEIAAKLVSMANKNRKEEDQ